MVRPFLLETGLPGRPPAPAIPGTVRWFSKTNFFMGGSSVFVCPGGDHGGGAGQGIAGPAVAGAALIASLRVRPFQFRSQGVAEWPPASGQARPETVPSLGFACIGGAGRRGAGSSRSSLPLLAGEQVDQDSDDRSDSGSAHQLRGPVKTQGRPMCRLAPGSVFSRWESRPLRLGDTSPDWVVAAFGLRFPAWRFLEAQARHRELGRAADPPWARADPSADRRPLGGLGARTVKTNRPLMDGGA